MVMLSWLGPRLLLQQQKNVKALDIIRRYMLATMSETSREVSIINKFENISLTKIRLRKMFDLKVGFDRLSLYVLFAQYVTLTDLRQGHRL